MSYQVIARKYRPQTFEEVIGQEHVTRTLLNSIKHDRIAHAFLFSGPRGCGKTTVARILAKSLTCETGIVPVPCNKCKACLSIINSSSLDVLEIDGASHRGIDEIRDLQENARYAPAVLRFKIFIIDEVHMLTREAFNALLKLVEEPPRYLKFMLATTEPHKVPVTILSRCQRYDFHLVSINEILGLLKKIAAAEKVHISEKSLRLIARLAEGSVRDAESLLEQVISFCGDQVNDQDVNLIANRISFEVIKKIAQEIIKGEVPNLLLDYNQLMDAGADPYNLGKELSELFRDIMVLKEVGESEEIYTYSASQLKELMELSKGVDKRTALQQFHIISEIAEELKRSSFPRILLEVTLVKAAEVVRLVPIESLIKTVSKGEPLHIGNQIEITRSSQSSATRNNPSPLAASDQAKEKRPKKQVEKQRTNDTLQVSDQEKEAFESGSLEGKWIILNDVLKRVAPDLKASLAYAIPVRMEGNSLIMGFKESDQDRIAARLVKNEKSQDMILKSLQAITGDDWKLEFKTLPNDYTALSAHERSDAQLEAKIKSLMRVAEENPVVIELKRRFDSKILKVKPLLEAAEQSYEPPENGD